MDSRVANIREYQHPFHLLSYSFLPLCAAAFAGSLAILVVLRLHNLAGYFCKYDFVAKFLSESLYGLKTNIHNSTQFLDFGIIFFILGIICIMWAWSNELIKEATFFGFHTTNVQRGLLYGMSLFLASEAMLFFPSFWAFFHASLSPSVALGSVWPPIGIQSVETLDPFMLPLVNTIVLLTSGVALVAAHRAIVTGCEKILINGLYITIMLGIFFSWLQYLEYGLTKYAINDTIFGSTFFMLTGLHGFHVIVGTCLLLIAYFRSVHKQFSTQHHIFFECAAWYWHFVDIVWLFVFAFVYIWSL